MASDVALRIAYFSLYLVGGFIMAIMIIMLCLGMRRLRKGLFVPSLALCSSRIISAVVSSLLLFAGSMTGKSPSDTLCMVQSGLHNAQTPFISFIVLSYAITFLLLITQTSSSQAPGVRVAKATLLAVPFVLLITLSIISVSQTNGVIVPLFYCNLEHKAVKLAATILTGLALFATIAIIFLIFVLLSRQRDQIQVLDLTWIEDFTLSLFLLGTYTAVRAGFWIANIVQPTITADMLDATDGILLFFIIATQGWLIKGWSNLSDRTSQRLSRNSGMRESNIPVHRHSVRQVVHPSSTINIRALDSIQEEEVQSPKLLALATAMGLNTELPAPAFNREVLNPSPKFQFPPRQMYSADAFPPSQVSLRSLEYGVALGHPSRDGSRDPTPAHLDRLSDEAKESIIRITPQPDHWSNYGQGNSDQGAGKTEFGSASIAPSRDIYLSPLVISSASRLPLPSSALASSHSDRISPGAIRAFTPHDSYIPVSMESRSRSTSPQVMYDAHTSLELQPPGSRHPLAPSSGIGDYSTEDGAHWSASSETNPPILLDASVSSLSWPNASPASLRPSNHLTSGSGASRLGIYSNSASIDHARGTSEFSVDSSQQLRALSSPSPLSLSEGHVPRPVISARSVPPSDSHPFARGMSPFRPPGLHRYSGEA